MQSNYWSHVPKSSASMRYEDPVACKIAALVSIKSDFAATSAVATAIEVILLSESPWDRMILESHTFHVLVRYARCYGQSRGRGLRLSKEDVETIGREDLMTLHLGLLKRRHQAFAHAGELTRSSLIANLVEHDDGPEVVLATLEETVGPISDPEQVRLLVELCSAMQNRVDELIAAEEAALDAAVLRDHNDLVTELRARLNRYETPEEIAVSILARFEGT